MMYHYSIPSRTLFPKQPANTSISINSQPELGVGVVRVLGKFCAIFVMLRQILMRPKRQSVSMKLGKSRSAREGTRRAYRRALCYIRWPVMTTNADSTQFISNIRICTRGVQNVTTALREPGAIK
eukprot:scaffold76402_cov33-Tisochrysis_lutea.AAC.3